MKLRDFGVTALTVGLLVGTGFAEAGDYKKEGKDSAKVEKMSEQRKISADHKMSKNERMAKLSREVRGTILKSKEVNLPGKTDSNLVVLIKTEKAGKELIVDLGDADLFAADVIRQDKKIEAEGRIVRMGQHNMLVARNVRVDGKLMKIDRKAQEKSLKKDSSS